MNLSLSPNGGICLTFSHFQPFSAKFSHSTWLRTLAENGSISAENGRMAGNVGFWINMAEFV